MEMNRAMVGYTHIWHDTHELQVGVIVSRWDTYTSWSRHQIWGDNCQEVSACVCGTFCMCSGHEVRWSDGLRAVGVWCVSLLLCLELLCPSLRHGYRCVTCVCVCPSRRCPRPWSTLEPVTPSWRSSKRNLRCRGSSEMAAWRVSASSCSPSANRLPNAFPSFLQQLMLLTASNWPLLNSS